MPSSDPPAPEPPNAAAEVPVPLTGPLLLVDQAELASVLAYGLRFDERGRPRRGAARASTTPPSVYLGPPATPPMAGSPPCRRADA